MMLDRRHYVALLGLALFAAGLALFLRLGHSLSVDEPFMANAVRLPWTELLTIFRTDNAPFTYLLFRLWTSVFGDSELALRSLSTVAYALAVLLTGLAAAGRGPAAAIAAAALMASSVRIGITYAATARPYALLAAFSAAATFLTLRSLLTFETQTHRWWLLAGLTTVHVLGLLTHPTYVFVLVPCGLAAALSAGQLRAPSALAAGAALLLYASIWGQVVVATVESGATSWMRQPGAADVQAAFLSLWGTGPGFMLAGAMLALALSNLARLRTTVRDRQVTWAAVATVVGWSMPIVLSVWQPVFLPARTPVLLLPLSAVFIAFVLSALASRVALGALVAVCVLAATAQVINAARAGDPTPSRDSIQEVLSAATCGDTLVALGVAHDAVDYYVPRLAAPGCISVERFPADMLNWTRRVTDQGEMRGIEEEAVQLVTRLSSGSRTIWVLSAERGIGHEASGVFLGTARARMMCGDPRPLKGAFFDHLTRCRS